MSRAIALTLVHNVALIVLLATVQQYILRYWARRDIVEKLLSGVLYGAVGIIAMMTPLTLAEGLIFDGRTIILSVAGMFGGPVVAAVAALMCGGFRYALGGIGMVAGVLSVIEAAGLGVVYYYLRRRSNVFMRPAALWAFGLLVTLLMLGSQLLLPRGLGWRVVDSIAIPVLILFPLGSLLVIRLLLDQEERLAAETRLASDEERLRLALQAADQGLYDLNVQTGDATVSPEYAQMLGYDPSTFHETNAAWIERLHPDDRERLSNSYRDYVDGRLPEYRVEFRQRKADGGYKWILSLGEIVERDGQGQPLRMIGTHTDIDRLKAVESELESYRGHLEELVQERTRELACTNERLEDATMAKNAFLAAMSHELRTPLNSIIGFSGLLAQGVTGVLTPDQLTQVEIINDSGKHLLSLIEDVLDLSKVESGKEQVHLGDLEVAGMVREAGEMMRPLAEEKGLDLRVAIVTDPGSIRTDSVKLRQILLNLLGNAVKFTDAGHVDLTLDCDDEGLVEISVQDTGVGIAQTDLPRVFDAFTQIETPGRSKPRGTGLGLALSREYAHLLGGEISVHSVVGEGSRFVFVVPEPSACGGDDSEG